MNKLIWIAGFLTATTALSACNEYSLFSPHGGPDATPTDTAEPTPQPTDEPPEYLGTEFWAVDLDNYWAPGEPNAAGAQFAVAISNATSENASVTVSNADGEYTALTIAPDGLEVVELPASDINDTSDTLDSWRIESDVPVSAHQFNPIGNDLVYSNDASLLLPTAALGEEYRVVSWPQTGVASDWNALRGFVTLVATQPGTTHIEVTPTGRIVGGDGVPAVNAGNLLEWDLEQFEVLSLATSTQGHDLTGSLVRTDQPVAAFGGSECSNVPLEMTACDHLEEQLIPVQAWGRSYVAAKSKQRGSEPDIWRIVAHTDGTTVTTEPAQPGTPKTLSAGEVLELESESSFVITASEPVTVAQYLVGRDYGAGIGDPAQMMAVPTEQFRQDYLFLTPPNYANDSITVVAPQGAQVTLDGAPVPSNSFEAVAQGWSRAVLDVSDGTHRLTAEVPIGVTVTGFDWYVSYGYPGGLNLESL